MIDLGMDDCILALTIAARGHAGQVDKAGRPYILHSIAVADSVRHLGTFYYVVALLHDIIEDTNHTAESLLAMELPSEVVRVVEILSHRGGESNIEYYARVRKDPVALTVKIADVEHNAGRLDDLSKADADRLRRKYKIALDELSRRENDENHH